MSRLAESAVLGFEMARRTIEAIGLAELIAEGGIDFPSLSNLFLTKKFLLSG